METDRPTSSPKFFTIAQVAEVMEISERTVRRWIKGKLLIAHRFNGLVRIAEADFQDFLIGHRDARVSADVYQRPAKSKRY